VGLLHDVSDLHRADQVRRDFVSNASHELRTPAAGIRALAEALSTYRGSLVAGPVAEDFGMEAIPNPFLGER